MGSGPKAPALRALMPPRPLAALDCGWLAALTGVGGGGDEPDEAPAEGMIGVATAAAPPAAAPAASPAAPAPAASHVSFKDVPCAEIITRLNEEPLLRWRRTVTD